MDGEREKTEEFPYALVGVDMEVVLNGVHTPDGRPLVESVCFHGLEHRLQHVFQQQDPNQYQPAKPSSRHCCKNNDGKSSSSSSSSTDLPPSSIPPSPIPPRKLDLEQIAGCRIVVVDLGNACWTHKHFSEDIQTRQYRAPEVIIGAKYDTSADMWSVACLVFELLTGDLLFNPRAGDHYGRDEDHLAQMMELLGKYPKKYATSGRRSRDFFNRKGELKHIHSLKYWGLEEVLQEKYKFAPADARAAGDFLIPLLDFNPQRRATAQECLHHPWLAPASTGEEVLLPSGEVVGEGDIGDVGCAAMAREKAAVAVEESQGKSK